MSALPASKQLRELEKIMRLRTMKAQRAYGKKQEEWNEFKRLVDESQAKIDAFQEQLSDVAQFKEERKKSNNSTTLQDISDRRRWLIYDQDLEVYYLGIAKGDLQDATKELAALKAAWLKAQHRESNIKDKSQLSLQAESEEAEALQEIEIEDLQLQGGSIHG